MQFQTVYSLLVKQSEILPWILLLWHKFKKIPQYCLIHLAQACNNFPYSVEQMEQNTIAIFLKRIVLSSQHTLEDDSQVYFQKSKA